MERRLAPRHIRQLQLVLVELVEGHPIPMVMRNISATGMNINIGHYFLPPGKSVLVSFSLIDHGQTRSFRLRATVVRCADSNAGLMFSHAEHEATRVLAEILDHLPTTT